MKKRFASACIVMLVATTTTIIACGGGDDGGGNGSGSGDADANTSIDGNIVVTDAPSGAMGLGQTCTPDMTGSGQGNCPAGYVCLTLMGGTGPWCSKPCAMGAGDMCAMGYTGPGVAGCINQISFNGGAAMNFCGITCSGDGVNGCTTATCTGVCPGALMCNATLMDSGGNAVGSACQ